MDNFEQKIDIRPPTGFRAAVFPAVVARSRATAAVNMRLACPGDDPGARGR